MPQGAVRQHLRSLRGEIRTACNERPNRNDRHLFKRADPIEELRRLLNEAQELDAEDERRLYPRLMSACCQRMKSGSISAFCPSLVVFSHSAKARSSRYMKLRASEVLQNSSYSSRISSCVIYFAFFNAPWFLNAIGTGLFHRWRIWRCALHSCNSSYYN